MQAIDTCKLGYGAPTAVAVLGNVVHELLVLLGGPEPSPQLLLVAARLLRHGGQPRGCRRWIGWAHSAAGAN